MDVWRTEQYCLWITSRIHVLLCWSLFLSMTSESHHQTLGWPTSVSVHNNIQPVPESNCHVSTCFKKSTIIPVSKCFELLVKNYIYSSLPSTLDPLVCLFQPFYRRHRSTDPPHLSHPDKKGSYVRLFTDWSSAVFWVPCCTSNFGSNTIIKCVYMSWHSFADTFTHITYYFLY